MIRNMTPEDYDEVYALWRSCPEMELNNLDDSRQGVLRFLARNPETAFVAEEEGRVAGVLLAGSDGRRGYIYHAGVRPEFRGRGIGTALVEAALEKLRALGITRQEVAEALKTATDGTSIGSWLENDESLTILMRAPESERSDPDSLISAWFRPSSLSRSIPIMQVVSGPASFGT